MKLGIIINSWNNEKTIIRAINSIKKNKNTKIVVIDDASKDNSIKILKKKKIEKKIDILHINKRNIGIAKSRNIGINLCKNTNYITFIDGDDYLNSSFVSFFFKKIKNSYEDLILFNFSYSLKEKIRKNNFFKLNKALDDKDIVDYFLKYLIKPNKNSLFTTCWSKLYKTRLLLKKKNQFNEKLHLCEDTDFVFRYLSIDKVKKVKYFNFSMYYHSLSDGKLNLKKSTFGINIDLKNQISFLVALESCKKFLLKKFSNKSLLNKKLNHCIGAYTSIYMIRSCLRINSIKTFIEVYLFWKKILRKEKINFALKDYLPIKANGNIIFSYFLKKKFFFISIIIAYFIAKKRYL